MQRLVEPSVRKNCNSQLLQQLCTPFPDLWNIRTCFCGGHWGWGAKFYQEANGQTPKIIALFLLGRIVLLASPLDQRHWLLLCSGMAVKCCMQPSSLTTDIRFFTLGLGSLAITMGVCWSFPGAKLILRSDGSFCCLSLAVYLTPPTLAVSLFNTCKYVSLFRHSATYLTFFASSGQGRGQVSPANACRHPRGQPSSELDLFVIASGR